MAERDQQGQRVGGDQLNVAGDADIGQVGDRVETGGDYVAGSVIGRDQFRVNSGYIIRAERGSTIIINERQASQERRLPSARIFVSYKRHAADDEALALYLKQFLDARGNRVFIDQTMRTGTRWLEEIDRQIRKADFLIVLLSAESAQSEMLQSEVRRAYACHQQQGKPDILPIRLNFEELLPYSIDAFINPLQYVVWRNQQDNERVGYEVLAAMGAILPAQPEITVLAQTKATDTKPTAPLPQADPRLADALPPGGAIRQQDWWLYIERKEDAKLHKQLHRNGTITTIRAPRQMGKSSLLIRGVAEAKSNRQHTVLLDLQRLNRRVLVSADTFLRYIAHFIARRLRLDTNVIDTHWQSGLGSQDKITYYLEDYVLPTLDRPLILAIDEADRLLETEFYSDFFAMLRFWYNNAALDPLWQMLNLVLVISTEPYLLIADVNQSPFNVGERLNLRDFNSEQIAKLNRQHGCPLNQQELPQLMQLLGGHPYLTRRAFHVLYSEGLSWLQLLEQATADTGAFADHLRHLQWIVWEQKTLRQSLQRVLRAKAVSDDLVYMRLVQAGLIKGSGTTFSMRCDLYQHYFAERL